MLRYMVKPFIYLSSNDPQHLNFLSFNPLFLKLYYKSGYNINPEHKDIVIKLFFGGKSVKIYYI